MSFGPHLFLALLEGTYVWEAMPRYADAKAPAHVQAYRKAVGVNDAGANASDAKDVSTFSHMFGCWETLYAIKNAVEKSNYRDPTPKDYRALIEYMESVKSYAEGPEHPQGEKTFNGRLHQCYGHQFVSQVENKRLKVVHRTKIEDSLYEPEADYTKQPL